MDEYRDVYDKNRVFQNRTILRGDKFKEGEVLRLLRSLVEKFQRRIVDYTT